MPLDDAWIHFRFAENFAHGHFFEYNIGAPTPGTTSPLWVVILAVPFLISRSLILPYALAVTLLFFFLTCIEVYRLGLYLKIGKEYALLAAILTAFNRRLIWSSLSGMEITLFCWLTLIIVFIHLREIDQKKLKAATGLLLGVAVLVRPEAYLLGILYYLSSFILLRKELKENLKPLILSAILFLAAISPYPIFSEFFTGRLLPNTFRGQLSDWNFLSGFDYIYTTFTYFEKDNPFIFLLLLFSVFYFSYTYIKRKADNRWLFIFLWVIFLPLASIFITHNSRHYGRYLMPIIPFINLTAIYILTKVFGYIRKNKPRLLKYTSALAVVLVLVSIGKAGTFGYLAGKNVDCINNQQVNIANWINRNLPEEKIIALNDIGAITFLTGKKIIDMEGLVTPEMLKFRRLKLEDQDPNVMRFLKSNNVNYLIIYPEWYSYLMKYYSHGLEKVYSAKLIERTICGGNEMFVFKINWDKINLTEN